MAELTGRGPLPFVKMSGSGNDFILMDNRQGILAGMDLPALARKVCSRYTSVGADGLIIIEPSRSAHFRWQFFNADGSRADMCGNGGRCAARFAHLSGIAPASLTFETGAGIVAAEVRGASVKVQLTRPKDYQPSIPLEVDGACLEVAFVNTGVPHAVILTDDVAAADVAGLGRLIRHHARFQPAGTNVNFAAVAGPRKLKLRTYERGVEAETMACGTGSAAAAFVAWKKSLAVPPVEVETTGGEILTISMEPAAGEEYPILFLEGRTILICRGGIEPEGYAQEYA